MAETITIDMDSRCKRCGHKGTVNATGHCLVCLGKQVDREAQRYRRRHRLDAPSAAGKPRTKALFP
jgi:hypothetical protein